MKIICFALCLTLATFGHAHDKGANLLFTISSKAPERDGSYLLDRPIPIRCVIENRGNDRQSIFLKDHDAYHGTLPYPTTLQVSSLVKEGEILLENWSQYAMWSSIFEEMPGDRITLLPGEKVTRIVQLEQIIAGSSVELLAGTYDVQLGLPEAQSNRLTIVLKTKSAQDAE